MHRLLSVLVAVAAVAMSCGGAVEPPKVGVPVPAGGQIPIETEPPDAEDLADPRWVDRPPAAPPGGVILQPGLVRVPKPNIDLTAARKVGIQIGHWDTMDVPAEYGTRIQTQTGTSWGGVTEVDVCTDIADRLARLLRAQSVEVDILPTTVPKGYLADVFISLHLDGDGVGALSGFKLAHSTRRSPHEPRLMSIIKETYGSLTGLRYDAEHVTNNMLRYYAFNWSRYQYATSPFTPSVILEMGFLSHRGDRSLMLNQPDRVAIAIANGILKFLDETPRSKIFAEDLILPQAPRRGATPSPTSAP